VTATSVVAIQSASWQTAINTEILQSRAAVWLGKVLRSRRQYLLRKVCETAVPLIGCSEPGTPKVALRWQEMLIGSNPFLLYKAMYEAFRL
jgi:hypothetical protein